MSRIANKDTEKQRKLKAKVLKLRTTRRENQSTFWNRLGITQSGGSRYESSGEDLRGIPEPVSLLIDLVYGDKPLAKLAKLRNTTVAGLVALNK